MSEEKQDIKELMELLKAIEVIAVGAAKVAKDKKILPDDLLVLIDLMKQVDTFKDAFSGLKELPAEVKDLDETEIAQLIMAVFGIVKSVKDALK